MTQDNIIRMARDAGWSGLYTTFNEPTGKADWKMVKESLTVPVTMEQIERFVALIVAAEHEACAKVCEERQTPGTASVAILNGAADAIRARGKS